MLHDMIFDPKLVPLSSASPQQLLTPLLIGLLPFIFFHFL